ncbi:TolC family protein [bacterium]|nr:TolC family protein [bacterium]MBU1637524.1 TolC family protein [bacterium]MBU1920717.1 TolC family protein [bacterium]
MKRVPILLFTFLLFSSIGFAETLTIEKAVEIALEQSSAVQAAESRVDAASELYREAIGYRLPSVDVMEIVARTTNPAEAFAFQMNQERFSMQEFGNPANDPNNPDPLNTYITRAEASMPIYTGGMLPARAKQARLMAKAAKLEWERTRSQVVFDVSKAYADLQKARENLDLMLRMRESVRRHVERARNFYDEGLLVSSELLRAEVHLSEIEEWVTMANNGASLAEAALNFQMGIPRETAQQLEPLPDYSKNIGELNEWLAKSEEQRPDLMAARLKVKAGDYEAKAARSSFLPEIGLKARYEFYDDRLFGDNGESWSIMGVARINLFKGGVDRAKWSRNRHEAKANHHDMNRFEEGVRLEVQQAYGDLEAALLRHATASSAMEAGRENARVVEERFNQGIAKMLDLVDAETALRELEVRELSARYDAYVAHFRLKHAAGTATIESNEDIK